MTDTLDEPLTLSDRRDRGLNDLGYVINQIWGPHCEDHESGTCATCAAWAIYDCLAKLTDTRFR